MGATLLLFAWTNGAQGVSTSGSASSAVAINTSSCLSFGGGTRSQFQQNIAINTYNTSIHYAYNTNESSIDMCTNSHLWPITYLRSTAALLDGTYKNIANQTIASSQGIGIRFRYDFAVKVSPANIWAGTGVDVDGSPSKCVVQICDLTSTDPTWVAASASGKLALQPHGSSVAEHWWCVGLSLKPIDVGFTATNKIKVELTYY